MKSDGENKSAVSSGEPSWRLSWKLSERSGRRCHIYSLRLNLPALQRRV